MFLSLSPLEQKDKPAPVAFSLQGIGTQQHLKHHAPFSPPFFTFSSLHIRGIVQKANGKQTQKISGKLHVGYLNYTITALPCGKKRVHNR